MAQININQLEQAFDLSGEEMLPIQLESSTNKVSVDTILKRGKELFHKIQKYNYSELKQLKDSKLLIPGEHYILTDYQCIYTQPVSEETMTSEYDGWLILLLATAEDKFGTDVEIFFTEDSSYIVNGGKPIIECKYVFDNFIEYTWANTLSKGVIVDLTDSNGNRCNYDFKHIKFRRWALKDVTENNTVGAINQPAAYRCYGTAEEPKRSDSRTWVGSGLDIEREYVRSIFDGTFNSVMWGQAAVHEDYITRVHKPFKRTDEKLQYVSYDVTLDSISELNASTPGLAKFEIDSQDYIDCYTFDLDGVDVSNKIYTNSITTNNTTKLPNVVILVQSTLDFDTTLNSYIYNNKINASDVTIAIHDLYEGTVPNLSNVSIDDLRKSIFCIFRMYQVKMLNTCSGNYLSGTFYDCTFESMQNSVLFGYYNAVSMKSCSYNLLFGNEMRIVNTNGDWVGPADGNYWYDCMIQEWFGYNIMAPFQYAVFYPHTNTNTIKLPYNKGVTLMGTFQDNYIERMRWGVVVEYGAIQGNYLTELTGTHVSPQAFSSQLKYVGGTSNMYKLEGSKQFPSMSNCNVEMYQCNLNKLTDNLTSDMVQLLQTRGNRKLFTNNGTLPILKYYYL